MAPQPKRVSVSATQIKEALGMCCSFTWHGVRPRQGEPFSSGERGLTLAAYSHALPQAGQGPAQRIAALLEL
jgi:hypothetical protein